MIVHLGNNKKPCFALESSVVLPLLCNNFDLDKLDFLCLLITWLLVALDPSQRLTGRRMGEAMVSTLPLLFCDQVMLTLQFLKLALELSHMLFP